MKAHRRILFSLAIAALFSFPPSAEAALGDFIFRIGVDYHFDAPTGVATDSAGQIFVVDGLQNEVSVFDPAGNLTRKFAASTSYSAGLYDIDIDPPGNVYILKGNEPGGIVKVFDNNGVLLRGFGASGYPGGDGVFVQPGSIGVDPVTGYVYVTDKFEHVVQVFDDNGTFVRKWGGFGTEPYNLREPEGVAVDMDGNVYVCERRGLAIKVYDRNGIFVSSFKTWGGPMDVAVDRVTGAIHVFETGSPSGVHVYDRYWNPIRQYGHEASPYQNRIRITVDRNGNGYATSANYLDGGGVMAFDAAGAYVRLLAAFGSEAGRFNEPGQLAVDGQGRIYVADTRNHRVQVFDPDGVYLRSWGSYGTGLGELSSPTGIAVKGNGNVYVSERGRIHVFTQDGIFLRSWGSTGWGVGELNYVVAIDVDEAGNVYAADPGNHRIVVFDANGNYINAWGLGYQSPFDIAVDAAGFIHALALDGWNSWADILIFNNSGSFVDRWSSVGYGTHTFALDSCGNTYLTGIQEQVRVFDKNRTLLAEWGTTGYEPGSFLAPAGIEAPGNGRVYVSELGNHRVQVFEGLGSCGTVSADAGPDRTVEQTGPAGAEVTLDGSASEGYCDDALTYDWSWAGGTATGANPNVLLPAGTSTVTLTVACGTSQAQDSISVTVQDTQAPVTTAAVTGSSGTNGWYVSDVTVTLAASDSGSGVKDIRYALNAMAEVVVPGSTASVVLLEDGTYDLRYHAADLAGNIEAEHPLILKMDKTPPTVVITGVQDGATYLVGSAPAAGYTASDNLSGLASENAGLSGGNGNGLGTFTYTVTAVDNAGNTTLASATYKITYAFSDFLGNLGDHKPFKLGSTVPVKFSLMDGFGNLISTAVARISLQMYTDEVPVGDPIEGTSTSGADTGNTFRYDASAGHYIYNLSTDSLSVGTWMLTVTLDDGTAKSILLGIK